MSRPHAVELALGAHDQLLSVALDVAEAATIGAAVDGALGRFGRIDVLVSRVSEELGGWRELSLSTDFES